MQPVFHGKAGPFFFCGSFAFFGPPKWWNLPTQVMKGQLQYSMTFRHLISGPQNLPRFTIYYLPFCFEVDIYWYMNKYVNISTYM